jgi:4-hydroxy-3-methylbut-2-enyl diphosphate reductase
MGAIFIDELKDAAADRPVIFSAHGVARSVHDEARERGLSTIDATCPLVLKVHNEVRRHIAAGRHVFLVGHRGHPEIIGTAGQAPFGATTIVESADAARRIAAPAGPLAYATQTTLSVDDAEAIVAVLKSRFPDIEGPRRADICYATSNRQAAVKLIAPGADAVLVVGSPQSSNSVRLVETASAAGAFSMLVEDPAAFDSTVLDHARIIGVTSGASTPEELVEALLTRLAAQRSLAIETIEHVREDVTFKQPMLQAG